MPETLRFWCLVRKLTIAGTLLLAAAPRVFADVAIGDVTLTPDLTGVAATSVLTDSSSLPIYVEVNYAGSPSSYTFLDAEVSGNTVFTSLSALSYSSLLTYQNGDSSTTIDNSSVITWHDAQPGDSQSGQAGIKSLLILDTETGALPSNTINHSGSLTIDTSDAFAAPDVRVADFSGLLAISVGSILANSTGTPGGPVSVNTLGGSLIGITNSSTTASVTAGISAATQVAPGTAFVTSTANRTVSVSHAGTITVDALSAVGILATATGGVIGEIGQLATGAPVTVTVTETGSIDLSGGSGIGVFALSQVHTPQDADLTSLVTGGAVAVNLLADSGSQTLSVGEIHSTFSAGILAVSAGSEVWVNPFGSGNLNDRAGVGGGGTVTVTNDRTIQTLGTMSVGVAALSLGGASMATTAEGAEGDTFYVGNTGDTSSGYGGDVTVTSNGSITTLGYSAHGIVALSSGGGGLVNNDVPVGLVNDVSTGLVLGDNSENSAADWGGDVTVTLAGAITTGDGSGGGIGSIGVVAQSIGGGGGSAGGLNSVIALGGFGDPHATGGGTGGHGGTVTYTQASTASILTQDTNSVGVLAQSIGGGGGNGANAAGYAIAIGGSGGSGGYGDAVTATIDGSIVTMGLHSAGVILQSIGGGGGHGGGTTAIGLFSSKAIGGSGGAGGNGLDVTGTFSGTITTSNSNSSGVILQSIGGGGGTGGAAFSQSIGFQFSSAFALGGSGGDGGDSSSVTGSNYGTITTGQAGVVGLPNSNGADSVGMLGQSIAGGGGQAGSAVASSISVGVLEAGLNAQFSMAVGGSGGSGGIAGEVRLNNLGSITTLADASAGVLGQSIGGGGGLAGDASTASFYAGSAKGDVPFTISIGGSGGSGGSAAPVYLANGSSDNATASIKTCGQNSAGMVAQSIGGGGGIGGMGNAGERGVNQPGEGDTVSVTFALGGSGGSGGDGGQVDMTSYGEIETQGSTSVGMLGQSIGGGGGIASGGNVGGADDFVTFSVGVGGRGGDGGAAEDLTLKNFGTIVTTGGDSVGIMAQSIGGGGGDGGTSDASATIGPVTQFTDYLNPAKSWVGNVAVGGNGGDGNGSGTVVVLNELGAEVSTSGNRAHGILAQSVSGGGGRGGVATADSNNTFFFPWTGDGQYTANVAVGGDGGSSPTAGDASVTNDGQITTTGYASMGVVAQSIGGGGGVGASGSTDVEASLALGGRVNGSNGGDGGGGTTTVLNSGSISTSGHDAIGVLAQSIGGGGGLASSGNVIDPFKRSDAVFSPLRINYQIGFTRSTSVYSDGGAVNVNLGSSSAAGSVSTGGNWAFGIVGQSVGAGGGTASNITGTYSNAYTALAAQVGATDGKGNGGAVALTLDSDSTVATTGFGATGILLQSIGGGGGIGTDGSQNHVQADADPEGVTPGIQLGATGSEVNGTGGTITVSGTGGVTTTGDNALAVVLQSIGGGGGLFGAGTEEAPDTGLDDPVSINLGMKDNAMGAGRDVSVGSTTDATKIARLTISTSGANAIGLVAQSIGGGGGIALVNNTGTPTLGADGKDEQYGGEINITLAAGSSITTTGAGAHGIVTQSIGGGGGIANPDSAGGLTTTTSFTNSGTAKGYGQNSAITIDANVQVSGDGAVGLLSQVIGGGGGIFGDFAGSTGVGDSSSTPDLNGTLTITQSGTISASGSKGVGIFAQNVTGNGNGGATISVAVNGKVQGASDGTGVWMDGGDDSNTVTVSTGGLILSMGGDAIRYSGTNTVAVTNDGIVTGSLHLGDSGASCAGTFLNNGTLNSGSEIFARVTNDGLLSVGLDDSAGASTQFLANFQQNADGTISFTIGGQSLYDSVSFLGGTDGQFLGSLTASFVDSYLPSVGDRFDLILGVPGSTYSFDSVSVVGLSDSYSWTTGIDQSDNTFFLEITAVPEPQTICLLIAGLLSIVFVCRRRENRIRAKAQPMK